MTMQFTEEENDDASLERYNKAAQIVDKEIEIERGPCIFFNEPTPVDTYLRDLRIEVEILTRLLAEKAGLARSRVTLKVHEIKNLFPSFDGSSPLERAKEMSRIIDEMSDDEITFQLKKRLRYSETTRE